MEEFKTSNSHFNLIFLSSLHLFATFVHTKPPGKSGNVVRRVEHLGRLRQQVLQGLAVILRLPERNLFVCLTWDNARCLLHDGCIEVVIQLWYRVAWLDDTTITAGPLSFWKFKSWIRFWLFLKTISWMQGYLDRWGRGQGQVPPCTWGNMMIWSKYKYDILWFL